MDYQQSMLFAEDFPVKTSRWLEIAQAWLEAEADYGSSFIELLRELNRSRSSNRAYSG